MNAKCRMIARDYPSATILFADLIGFTALTEGVPAMTLVALLNELFSKFDAIAAELQVEKIKTIGDAYMVVSGIPQHRDDHTEVCVRFAFRILDALDEFNVGRAASGLPALGMRVGINAGSVVAGVIGESRAPFALAVCVCCSRSARSGQRKFLYDVWGSATNLASRMETNGMSGRVHVSQAVVDLCADVEDFRFIPRGLVYCKGIGEGDEVL